MRTLIGVEMIMLKAGNEFPTDRAGYALEIAKALQRDLGHNRRAVKTMMRWTGAGERTVKNWMTGEIGPSGAHLIALIRHSDAVLETVLFAANRRQAIAATSLIGARIALSKALSHIDALVIEADVP